LRIKFFVAPLITFVVILGIAAALSFINYSWSNWKPASCMPANCFCEAIHRGTVAQLANTWSSFYTIIRGCRHSPAEAL
jgi:hypothetical protein